MDSPTNNQQALSKITANRQMVDGLFKQGLISSEARAYALNFLYPANNWLLWISRILGALGLTLVLASIIYFAAFNWDKIPPMAKMISIQAAMAACLIGCYLSGLQKTLGKAFLLSASVLVGVFLAVYGQIYQTGADSYTLFLAWAIFITPWVIISNFAPLWTVWMVVLNLALYLYYFDQPFNIGSVLMSANSVPADYKEAYLANILAKPYSASTYAGIFYTLFLALREHLALKGAEWVKDRWTRRYLIIAALIHLYVPASAFINVCISSPSYLNLLPLSIIIGALFSLFAHIAFYKAYRHRLYSMEGVAVTVISICILVQILLSVLFAKLLNEDSPLSYLIQAIITLIIFSFAVKTLRSIARNMEEKRV